MSLTTLIAFSIGLSLVYYLCPGRFRQMLLLLASLAYYAYCGIRAVPFLLITGMSTWLGARAIASIGLQHKNYLKEHPDAMMKDVAAAVGITPHRLKMIDQNYHVLLPNTSRINLAKIRVKKTKAYLRQHPDAKTADIAKLLDVPKSTAYSILKRIEKKETKSNAT
jgi:hypothetical protein